MGAPVEDLIAEGRAALHAGDADAARRAFEAALVADDTGDAVEGLARAAYIAMSFTEAIEGWERAYAAYRDAGDQVGAIRVARTLAYMYGSILGDAAVMGGWLARASTLLLDAPADSSEAGWVALNIGMFEGDRDRRADRFGEALEVARRQGDTDLEFLALAYLGASLVHGDRTEEGMVLLDEALAAVAGSEVEDFCVLQEIFCQLFAACEHAQDITRADQWIRIGEAIAERRRLPAVSAFCRTHYGGLLTAAGRWPEADAALTEAVRLWALGHRSQRFGALARLGDLRVRQGRFEEAAQLLEGLDGNVDAARPIAAVHLANGQEARAIDVLERALAEVDPSGSAAAPLLALLVEAQLVAGRVEEAGGSADALAACADAHASHYLAALAALARGRVCLATGAGDGPARLREALAGFAKAELPMELAHARLALANAVRSDQPEVAMAEARAALGAFERLQAARDVDAAAAVLRSLGVRGGTGPWSSSLLTKREAEVLELVAHGLSNPEISDRLYISRKTVEHHVGNILAKLGLKTRGEAAAYATRTDPGAN